jgi:hypothetical protein
MLRGRGRLAVLCVGAVVVFAAVWWFGTLLASLACSGDGGSPYAAGDSAVGSLCAKRSEAGPVRTLWLVAVPLAPAVMVAGLTLTAIVRRAAPVIAGLVAGCVLVGLYTGPFLLLDNSCDPEEQVGYDRWARAGDYSQPRPFDCEKY